MNFARLGEALTGREEEVLFGLADGMTQLEIADELDISKYTVKGYADSMRVKLGAKTPAHAVALAYHRGILAIPTCGH